MAWKQKSPHGRHAYCLGKPEVKAVGSNAPRLTI